MTSNSVSREGTGVLVHIHWFTREVVRHSRELALYNSVLEICSSMFNQRNHSPTSNYSIRVCAAKQDIRIYAACTYNDNSELHSETPDIGPRNSGTSKTRTSRILAFYGYLHTKSPNQLFSGFPAQVSRTGLVLEVLLRI